MRRRSNWPNDADAKIYVDELGEFIRVRLSHLEVQQDITRDYNCPPLNNSIAAGFSEFAGRLA